MKGFLLHPSRAAMQWSEWSALLCSNSPHNHSHPQSYLSASVWQHEAALGGHGLRKPKQNSVWCWQETEHSPYRPRKWAAHEYAWNLRKSLTEWKETSLERGRKRQMEKYRMLYATIYFRRKSLYFSQHIITNRRVSRPLVLIFECRR